MNLWRARTADVLIYSVACLVTLIVGFVLRTPWILFLMDLNEVWPSAFLSGLVTLSFFTPLPILVLGLPVGVLLLPLLSKRQPRFWLALASLIWIAPLGLALFQTRFLPFWSSHAQMLLVGIAICFVLGYFWTDRVVFRKSLREVAQ